MPQNRIIETIEGKHMLTLNESLYKWEINIRDHCEM